MSLPGFSKKQAPRIKSLNIDYEQHDDIALTKQNTLRKTVGILGMLLPLLIYLFLLVDTGRTSELPSISHYYFTRSAGIFIIVVSLLAIFLLVYKGDKPVEFYLSAIAGIFALFVVLFPTDNLSAMICNNCEGNAGGFKDNYVVTHLKESGFRRTFHYVSAAIFLGSLAIMSYWLFPKSPAPADHKAKQRQNKRHFIYKCCAVGMIVALAIILIGFLLGDRWPSYDKWNLTFWMEVVAVEFFGFSWLVKGKALIKE